MKKFQLTHYPGNIPLPILKQGDQSLKVAVRSFDQIALIFVSQRLLFTIS